MARILLGVTGGIAAYKAVELARLAGKAGHSLRVVQTPASLNFVGRATFVVRAFDGTDFSAPLTVTINVKSVFSLRR